MGATQKKQTDNKLTVKQRKFVQGIVAGKPQYKAYEDAGYKTSSDLVARVESTNQLAKPNVQKALQEALAKYNLTTDRLVKPISDAIDADKVVIVGQGDDAFADVQPDHAIRLKAAAMGLRLTGADRQEVPNNIYNFVKITSQDKDNFFKEDE